MRSQVQFLKNRPYLGAVVQLVRMSACHVEGREFKSRQSRHIKGIFMEIKRYALYKHFTLSNKWKVVYEGESPCTKNYFHIYDVTHYDNGKVVYITPK